MKKKLLFTLRWSRSPTGLAAIISLCLVNFLFTKKKGKILNQPHHSFRTQKVNVMEEYVLPPAAVTSSLAISSDHPFAKYQPLPRVTAPTEGRNSITYPPSSALQDTTKVLFIDNKAYDIVNLNVDRTHSDFLTNVIHNPDLTPNDAATQNVHLDERSRWGAKLRTYLKTNAPNCTEFFQSNSFRVRVISERRGEELSYEWTTLTLPEGNYTINEIIDLMNNAVIEHYLNGPRQKGVLYNDIGVKFDTRNFNLGKDPVNTLVTPGTYTYKGYHPDIILLPGCAVDFSKSRLSNHLGIRKRLPYIPGFVLTYEDLEFGNIPALLDRSKYPGEQVPLEQDENRISYNVVSDGQGGWTTTYRSWLSAYHVQNSPARQDTLLTVPDPTGGLGQLYWSLPDTFKPPVTFKNNNDRFPPVVAMQLFPVIPRAIYTPTAVYGQMVEESTNSTMIFNRFPMNQILMQPPHLSATYMSENVPSVLDHDAQPCLNNLSGVQRVIIHDERRRPCPYVTKSLAEAIPGILSSATLR